MSDADQQADTDPLLDDETEIMVGYSVHRLRIRQIDGVWLITSRRTKGVCAGHKTLLGAMNAARFQIKKLAEHRDRCPDVQAPSGGDE